MFLVGDFLGFRFLGFLPNIRIWGLIPWSAVFGALRALRACLDCSAKGAIAGEIFVEKYVVHRVPMRMAFVLDARWVERWALHRRELRDLGSLIWVG